MMRWCPFRIGFNFSQLMNTRSKCEINSAIWIPFLLKQTYFWTFRHIWWNRINSLGINIKCEFESIMMRFFHLEFPSKLPTPKQPRAVRHANMLQLQFKRFQDFIILIIDEDRIWWNLFSHWQCLVVCPNANEEQQRWISWNWKIINHRMNDICNCTRRCLCLVGMNFSWCFFTISWNSQYTTAKLNKNWMKRAHIPYLKFKMRANFLMMNLTIWHRSRLNWSIKLFFFCA